MSRMSDIMEMVKQGYSVKEIKEVFELGKEIESEPEETAETAQEENTERGETDPDPVQDQTADPARSDPEPDYKSKYEELLKKYQQNNVRQDISGNNEEKSVEEAARDVLAAMIGG